MIRRLSILILAFSISTYALNAADNDESGLGEVAEPPAKTRKLDACGIAYDVPEVSIDLSSRFRNDVVTTLDLSKSEHLKDINFLLGFPYLTDLNLSLCFGLKNNYKQISFLTTLKKLNLRATLLTDLSHISSLMNLTSLDISLNKIKETIKYLIPLKKLKTLNLSGNEYITDLERLPELKSLKNLNLSEILCYNSDTSEEPIYKSIDFLVGIKGLAKLNLSFNHFIRYIKPLTKISTLIKLNLSGCNSIQDLNNLRKIEQLKKINLSYIELNPETLSHINNLRNLKSLEELIISNPIVKFPENVKITLI